MDMERWDMERCFTLIVGLNSMITDNRDAVTVRPGSPIEIAVDLGLVVESPLHCSLLVTCTSTNIELQLEPKDGVDGLLPFLHEELKDDLQGGNIERILDVVKCYFSHSPSENSCDDEIGSTTSSIRSQAFSLPSYYQSMYEELNIIGKGGYGRVFECRHKLDGMRYAVKKIMFNEDNEDQVIREVKIMAQLHHPNIIRYHQAWIEEGCEIPSTDDSSHGSSHDTDNSNQPTKTLYVAMEFCYGTLEEVIENEVLDPETIRKYFRQMVQGLAYMHKKGIVHRDLSKQNILLDSNGDIKIGDFGFAILFDRAAADSSTMMSTSGPVGNVSYRAPEMTRSPTYINDKTDVFSLGLILFEMVHQMKTQAERATKFDKIRKASVDWSTINLGPYDFIHELLEIDPYKRISAEQALE
ncbi:uncharacterized protein [Henckelia pumila]|uniref:uncharacterized protein n=1 Tax=Henckelia pumila TaxID=405737 RepID=UPI003C6EA42C